MDKNSKFLKIIMIFVLICQVWFMYIMMNFTFIGIYVEKNAVGQWFVIGYEDEGVRTHLNITEGDQIIRINGKEPGLHHTLVRWKSIQQAKEIEVMREGKILKVVPTYQIDIWQYVILPLVSEVICLFFAALLYVKARQTISARYLSLVFFNVGLIFMSLGASSRGDSTGKIMLTVLIISLPVVFFHFLNVFFKEKANITINNIYLKLMYVTVVLSFFSLLCFYIPSVAHDIYVFFNKVMITLFLIDFIICLYFLIYIYYKYGRENQYLKTMIKTVYLALFISFFPFTAYFLLPKLFHTEWLNPYYTSWFILLFPLSFAYLIVAKRLYDLDIILRRTIYTIFISIIPSLILVFINFSVHGSSSIRDEIISFLLTVFLLTIIFHSLEYIGTKLEPVIFPRKHHLQLALKKISKNLSSIRNFNEMKEIILVDIVSTIQVYGAAVVIQGKDDIEVIYEGDLDDQEVKLVILEQDFDHPSYTIFQVNQHEEYSSYLVMTQKRTNTMLSMEEKN